MRKVTREPVVEQAEFTCDFCGREATGYGESYPAKWICLRAHASQFDARLPWHDVNADVCGECVVLAMKLLRCANLVPAPKAEAQ